MNLSGMTSVRCGCGQTHYFTPSAMALLLRIGQEGEWHYVSAKGTIESICLVTAIESIEPSDPRYSEIRGSIGYARDKETRESYSVPITFSD
jgi:hypothetical protein